MSAENPRTLGSLGRAQFPVGIDRRSKPLMGLRAGQPTLPMWPFVLCSANGSGLVAGLVSWLVSDGKVRDDVAQETWLRVVRGLAATRDPRAPIASSRAVCRSTGGGECRRRDRDGRNRRARVAPSIMRSCHCFTSHASWARYAPPADEPIAGAKLRILRSTNGDGRSGRCPAQPDRARRAFPAARHGTPLTAFEVPATNKSRKIVVLQRALPSY